MSGNQMILLGGSQAPAVDPYFYSVTSLLHGDGTNGGQNNTFLDSSTNNFTITRNGNTTQGSFSPFSQTGWSNYFSTNSVSLTDSSNLLDLGGAAASVELFVYPTAAGVQVIFSKHGGSSSWSTSNGFEYQIQFVNNIFNFIYNSSGSPVTITDSVARSANAWYYIVVATDTSNNISFYINGIRVATGTNAITKPSSRTAVLLGNDLNNNYTVAYVSNLRFVSGSNAINPASTTITVPTTALTAVTGTQLLISQSNRFVDNSSNAFAITVTGSPSVQPFSPFNPTTPYSTSSIGGSGYFDGSGDKLTLANNAAFDCGTGNDMCWEAWVYVPSSNSSGDFYIWSAHTGGVSNGFYLTFNSASGAQRSGLIVYSGGGGGGGMHSNIDTPFNSWNHICVTRQSGRLRFFVNGELTATTTTSYQLNTDGNLLGIDGGNNFTGGAGWNGGGRYINGSVPTDYQTSSTTLNAKIFTPPTAPFTTTSQGATSGDVKVLVNFTNGAIFDNAAVADYETVGNAQISTSVKKYGTGSMYFDGSGDYLTTPYSQSINFGTGDFTIEGWFYLSSFANQYYVLGGTWSSATSDEWLIQIENNGSLRFLTTANTSFFATGLIKTGTWYHFAASRNAGVIKAYINGSVFATIANTNSIGSVSKTLNIGQQPGGSWPWNGYLDDWRVTKGIGRYPYNFTPPTAEFPNIGGTVTLTADPYFDYTTLLLPGNGTNGAQNNTFLDSSTNAFSITRNGNTTQGTFSPFSQTGWGNYFDGSGDYLQAGTNGNLALGSGDFTIEGWFFCTGYNGGAAFYSTINTYPSSTGIICYLFSTGEYTLNVNGADILKTVAKAPLNSWTHVAVVRNSNTITIYENGTSVGTVSNSTNLTDQYSVIGRTGAGAASNYFLGYLSNIRMVKGTAVYTAAFIPPTSPLTAISNTQMLTCQSNRFIDNSSNAFAITRNGDVSVQAFSPFNPTAAWSASTNGGSGYFDGSGDYLNIGSGTNNFALSGDFCVEAWIYRNANTDGTIIGNYNSSPNRGWSFRSYTSNNLYMYFQIDGGAEIVYTTGSGTLPLSAWSHVVWCRSGTNTSVYINGTRADNRTLSGTSTGNGGLSVSALSQSRGDINFNGYIANARLVNGSSVYDPSQSTITVPTSPLTAVSNTQLLCNFTNAGIYDATSKNDLETVGNAQISTTQSKFGGSSMYFDGTGDWLIGRTTDLASFGTGDFTIEGWLYPSAVTGADRCIWDTRAASGDAGMVVFIGTAGTMATYSSGSVRVVSTNALSANTWQHFALCRYNGTMAYYINGVQNGTLSYSSAITCPGRISVGVRFDDAAPYTGYINDLRITKGIARYTSNFTPPTTAFPLL